MINAIQIALSGLNAASRKADASAAAIATAPTQPAPDAAEAPETPITRPVPAVATEVDLVTEIVNLKQASLSYKANLKTIAVATDMQEALLGIFDRKV